jgi:hypothetical protein
MSFKYERDSFQGAGGPGLANPSSLPGAAGAAAAAFKDGRIPGTTGHHPYVEKIGTALTGGRQDAGTKGYLAVSVAHLLGSIWTFNELQFTVTDSNM